MDIVKVGKSLQDVLSEYEDLRGRRVDVEVIWAKDSRTHISIKVPEEAQKVEKDGAEVAEETTLGIVTSVMQIMRDQMDLMQDKMIGHEEDERFLPICAQMTEMGRVIEQIYNAIESSERLKRIPML